MRRPRLKLLHTSACYHVICRITQGQLWLGVAEKEYLLALLQRVALYCGVEVLTFCIMSNHFHLLVRIPQKTTADAKLEPIQLFNRVRKLYGDESADRLQALHQGAVTDGIKALWEAELATHRARMHDLSVFMKLLKQRFTMWHNHTHSTRGTLWTERFKSVLVESRDGARNPVHLVAAYIDLNPVRARVVTMASEYAYSGCGSAALGNAESQRGIMELTQIDNAAEALNSYQERLSGNFPPLESAEEPPIPTTALRSRQAAFVKGAVLGSMEFVLEVLDSMVSIHQGFRPQAYATGGMGGGLWVGQRFRLNR
jgi:putative transposase